MVGTKSQIMHTQIHSAAKPSKTALTMTQCGNAARVIWKNLDLITSTLFLLLPLNRRFGN